MYVRETGGQLSAGNWEWGEANTVSLSCMLIERRFVRVIEFMVEGSEIREGLAGLIDEPEIKIPGQELSLIHISEPTRPKR